MSENCYRKLKTNLGRYNAAAKLSEGNTDVKLSVDALQSGVNFVVSSEASEALISTILADNYKADFNFTSLPVWKNKLAILVQTYCNATLKHLEHTPYSHRTEDEDNKEADAVIKAYLHGIKFWAPFIAALASCPDAASTHANRKSKKVSAPVQKLILKLCSIWSHAAKPVALFAYAAMESLIISDVPQIPSMPKAPSTLKESILKGVFTAHVRNLRANMNPYTLKSLSFQRQCIKSLYLCDEDAGYPVAFGFIRQLGTYMRNSIHDATSEGKHRDSVKATRKKNKEEGIKTTNLNINTNKALKAVLSWRYFGSIQVWVELVSSDSQVYGQLIYPLASIIQGLMSLAPSTLYMAPLYLHCATLLNALAMNKNTFIPVLAPLMTILNSPDITSSPGPAPKVLRRHTTGLVDTSCVLRVGPTLAQTQVYRDTIVHDSLYACKEFCLVNMHSLAYPELVSPIVKELLLLHKTLAGSQHGVHRAWARMYKKTAQLIEDSAKPTLAKRTAVEFGPNDVEKVKALEDELRAEVLSQLNSEKSSVALIQDIKELREHADRTVTIQADGVVGEDLKAAEDFSPADTEEEKQVPRKMKLKEVELDQLLREESDMEDEPIEEVHDSEDDNVEEMSFSSE